jgi:hypothetical protein
MVSLDMETTSSQVMGASSPHTDSSKDSRALLEPQAQKAIVA